MDKLVACAYSLLLAFALPFEHVTDADRLQCTDILSLQDPQTGSFAGDILNERSSRFSYCAVAALSLLGRLDMVDVDLTVQWIKGCRNFDGGFGMCPGAESHAAYGPFVSFTFSRLSFISCMHAQGVLKG